jgi:hypothetical protein
MPNTLEDCFESADSANDPTPPKPITTASHDMLCMFLCVYVKAQENPKGTQGGAQIQSVLATPKPLPPIWDLCLFFLWVYFVFDVIVTLYVLVRFFHVSHKIRTTRTKPF